MFRVVRFYMARRGLRPTGFLAAFRQRSERYDPRMSGLYDLVWLSAAPRLPDSIAAWLREKRRSIFLSAPDINLRLL